MNCWKVWAFDREASGVSRVAAWGVNSLRPTPRPSPLTLSEGEQHE